METTELYQLRAEEFERNFMSLREIEWRTAIEVFTGYAALALAYFHLRDKYQGSQLLGVSAVLLDVTLFVVSWYLSARVQERLHYTRAMQTMYMAHLNIPELKKPDTVAEPKHKGWYAYRAQMTLSFSAAASLFVYFLGTTTWKSFPWFQVCVDFVAKF